MDGHHTPGKAINFLFWSICRSCSLSISLFISYIGINTISCNHVFHLSLIRNSFIMFNKYHFRFVFFCHFVVCMCIHVYVKLFLYEFLWFMFIAYVYVCWHNYIYYFAFICLHVFLLCGFTVVMSTFLRISLFGYVHDMRTFLGSVNTDD